MRAFGNVLWHFPFFGFVDAFFAYSLGFLLTLTVVGAPIGLGLMEYGKFLLSPFGKEMIRKTELNISQTPAGKAFSTFITIIYLPFGIVICAAACIQIFLLFISVFGIPVGMILAKSLGTFLNPVNKICVSSALATELERGKAVQELAKLEGTAAIPVAADTSEIGAAHVVSTASHRIVEQNGTVDGEPLAPDESFSPNDKTLTVDASAAAESGKTLEVKESLIMSTSSADKADVNGFCDDQNTLDQSLHKVKSNDNSYGTKRWSTQEPVKSSRSNSKTVACVVVALVCLVIILFAVCRNSANSDKAVKIINDLRLVKSAALLYYVDHLDTSPTVNIDLLKPYVDRDISQYTFQSTADGAWYIGYKQDMSEGTKRALKDRADKYGLLKNEAEQYDGGPQLFMLARAGGEQPKKKEGAVTQAYEEIMEAREEAQVAFLTGTNVNFRAAPDLKASVIANLTGEESLLAYKKSSDGKWTRVSVNVKEEIRRGWIYSEYIGYPLYSNNTISVELVQGVLNSLGRNKRSILRNLGSPKRKAYYEGTMNSCNLPVDEYYYSDLAIYFVGDGLCYISTTRHEILDGLPIGSLGNAVKAKLGTPSIVREKKEFDEWVYYTEDDDMHRCSILFRVGKKDRKIIMITASDYYEL